MGRQGGLGGVGEVGTVGKMRVRCGERRGWGVARDRCFVLLHQFSLYLGLIYRYSLSTLPCVSNPGASNSRRSREPREAVRERYCVSSLTAPIVYLYLSLSTSALLW